MLYPIATVSQSTQPAIQMPRTAIATDLFDPIGSYSHVVKVGPQIFVSGAPGVDPHTQALAGVSAYAQAVRAFKNIIACVQAAGGTETDIASVQVNLINVADFSEMNRAFSENFTQPYPARTVIGIAALP